MKKENETKNWEEEFDKNFLGWGMIIWEILDGLKLYPPSKISKKLLESKSKQQALELKDFIFTIKSFIRQVINQNRQKTLEEVKELLPDCTGCTNPNSEGTHQLTSKQHLFEKLERSEK